MARAYSDDLRCKLLEAYEAGRGSLQELAKQFGVSWGYSKKISCPAVEDGAEGAAVADPAWPGQPLDACRRAAVAVRPAATT